jgi:hypothetical protein
VQNWLKVLAATFFEDGVKNWPNDMQSALFPMATK